MIIDFVTIHLIIIDFYLLQSMKISFRLQIIEIV